MNPNYDLKYFVTILVILPSLSPYIFNKHLSISNTELKVIKGQFLYSLYKQEGLGICHFC